MVNQLTKGFVAAIVAVAGFLAPISLAGASTAKVSTSIGYDISYPQCGGDFPTSAGFGVIGVNDGHPLSANPCLASELKWAETLANDAPSFYMNTSTPGPAYSSGWPSSQQTPQVCSGANSPACSYDYGWNAAKVSYANAVAAETQDGVTAPSTAAISAHWWLDVETGNSWETLESKYGPTAASDTNDQQMLQGSIAYLSGVGVTSIGIYSTGSQWRTITGNAGSTFAATQVWMPGYATLSAAQSACLLASFTGGRVAMIQYPLNGLDGDFVCGLLSTPTSASVTVPGATTFTDQLAVTGNIGTVTYVQTGGSPNVTVSSTGLVATSGALSAGTYIATGTTSDTNGDQGTFTFTLSVGTITQASPTSTAVTVPGSSTFTDQLNVTGAAASTTYVMTSGSPDLTVSSPGVVASVGALAPGTYTVAGTTSDSIGDQGTFTFTLSVGTITQATPTLSLVTPTASSSFNHQLVVTGNVGTVTYVQTTGTPDLTVSSSGLVATNGALPTGSYVVRGTTSDPGGDVGKFFYNLVVVAPTTTTTTTTTIQTSPTTTTTTIPKVLIPDAFGVAGHAVAGRSVILAISGVGFFGRPLVTSHAGTTALVTRDSGTLLALKVTVKPRSRNGVFTFKIILANGKSCRVKYNQR